MEKYNPTTSRITIYCMQEGIGSVVMSGATTSDRCGALTSGNLCVCGEGGGYTNETAHVFKFIPTCADRFGASILFN